MSEPTSNQPVATPAPRLTDGWRTAVIIATVIGFIAGAATGGLIDGVLNGAIYFAIFGGIGAFFTARKVNR